MKRIRPFHDSQYIKGITGVRRCGKSQLLLQIINEIKSKGVDNAHIIVLNLEGKSGEGITIDENSFDNYLQFGGLPQRFEEIDGNGIHQYLIDLFKSIIEKDVFGNHKKINKTMFDQIGKYIISTTGRAFSALSISKSLKNGLTNDEYKSISKTIFSYSEYLEECYFMTECLPYYLKGKERLKGVKKYYAIDVGLRNTLGNVIDLDDTFALKGIVYNELKARGYEVKYGKMRNREIDFIAIKG